MKRLTKDNDVDNYELKETAELNGYNVLWEVKSINNAIQKLGQLEDIEDELGINLITFVEIIKHYLSNKNVFAKGGKEKCLYAIDLENGYVALKDLSGGALLCGHRIKDYGKTWALTKEELEK